MGKEKILQTKILADLRGRQGVKAFKIEKCSDNGCPDIFFTSKETGACFIEVKEPGEKPKPHQNAFLAQLINCGTKAGWCDTWERWIEFKKMVGLI